MKDHCIGDHAVVNQRFGAGAGDDVALQFPALGVGLNVTKGNVK